MKKKIFSLTLVGLVFGVTAFAATTVSLEPVNVSVKQGQNFDLAVSVNPQSVKNYTVKLEIKYPADLLEVKSFTLSSNWMALVATGYDTTIENANINGVLIKTAGYPGGLNSNASFGTIVFKAKKSGNATIQVTGNSLALDANNQNVISGLPVETFVAIAQPVAPSPEQTKPKEATPPITQPLPEEKRTTTEEVQQPLPQVSEGPVVEGPNPFLAAISSFITLGTGNSIVGIAVVFVIALIIYLLINAYFVKKKKQVGKPR